MDRLIAVHLRANVNGYTGPVGQAAAATRQLDQAGRAASGGVGQLGTSSQRAQGALRGLAVPLGGVAIGMAAIGAAGWAVNTVVEFDSAFAGVAKTVDATEPELATLREGIIQLSRELPAGTTEIAAVAEAAGQLGIQTPNILAFSEVMVGLGEATNLSSDEAATGLARFANIMGTSQEEFDRMGSTLVDLGNKGASTEAEILAMSLRLAGAGHQVGLTEAEVMSFANALSSVGIEAEAGGSAVSTVMVKMNSAVLDGGDALAVFAETAGMSAEEFARAWQTDPPAAFAAFTAGLQRVTDEGGNADAILDEVSLGGIRTSLSLKNLAGAGDLLTESVANGNAAWSENTALQAEVERRYATAASKLKVMRNNMAAFVIEAGSNALPAMVSVLEDGVGWMQSFGDVAGRVATEFRPAWDSMVEVVSELYENVEPLLVGLAQIGGAAILGGVLGLAAGLEAVAGFLADHEELVAMIAAVYVGSLVPGIWASVHAWGATKATGLVSWLDEASTLLRVVAAESRAAAAASGWAAGMKSGLSGLAEMINPAALAIGGAAIAAYGIATAMDEGRANADAFIETVNSKWANVPGITGMLGRINDLKTEYNSLVDQAADQGAWEQLGSNLADVLVPFHNVEDSAFDLRGELGQLESEIGNSEEDWARWGIAIGDIRGEFIKLGLAIPSDEQVEALMAAMDLKPGELPTFDVYTEGAREMLQANMDATPAALALAEATGTFADSASDAEDRADALKKALDSLFGIELDLHDAQLQWVAGLEEIRAGLDETAFSLDLMTEDGRAWRSAMSGSTQDALDFASAMYDNGASLQEVGVFLNQHRQSLLDVMLQNGMTEDQAESYLATLGMTPELIDTMVALLSEQAMTDAHEVQTELAIIDEMHVTPQVFLDAEQALTTLGTIRDGLVHLQSGVTIPLSIIHPQVLVEEANRGPAPTNGPNNGNGPLRPPATGGPLAPSSSAPDPNRSSGMLLGTMGGGGGGSSSGGVSVSVGAGAVQVSVTGAGGDTAAVRQAVADAVGPALDTFAGQLAARIVNRGDGAE